MDDDEFAREYGLHKNPPRAATIEEIAELWRAVREPIVSSCADDASELYSFLENHGFRVP